MIAFIILHYKNLKDTLDCINSLESFVNSGHKIIVVANGSKDNNICELKSSKLEFDLLISDNNLGFAKGNNKGILYAKEKYNPDFVIVLNSDIVYCNGYIEKELDSIYAKYQFDVAGPKILDKNLNNQNPNYSVLKNKFEIFVHLLRMDVTFFLVQINLYFFIKKIFKKIRNTENGRKVIEQNVIIENVPLHGSAIIFSKKYIKKFKDPFDESTFLYGEEEYLFMRMKYFHLKFVYIPSISFFHKEDGSLDKLFSANDKGKLKFIIFQTRKSLKKLLLTNFKKEII